jgi:hypothetical protein
MNENENIIIHNDDDDIWIKKNLEIKILRNLSN